MVLDLAGAVTKRPLLHKPQAASGTHRCLRQRLQRQSRALRLDQEKGPSTPIQRPPYHSALIPGTRLGTLREFIMAHPTEEQIRKRAFELWERAGKSEGREDEFWQQAQRELQDAEERGDLDK